MVVGRMRSFAASAVRSVFDRLVRRRCGRERRVFEMFFPFNVGSGGVNGDELTRKSSGPWRSWDD